MKSIIKQLLYIAFAIPVIMQAQSSVSGDVADEGANLPLPGVNISIQGTSRGAVTDFNGKFKIEPISKGQVLVFEYLGFKTKMVTYTGQETLEVKLVEDITGLSEVVLIGYGSAQKENVTGAVAQVSEKEFNQGAIVSPDQLLTAKTPGVLVTSDGGVPGGGARIRIRGGSSINASSEPLIVVDGIPLDQKGVSGVRNQLNAINPNDIKDFVVLKDAASTAIYGSRASNGVILITTKKGRKESPWEFSVDSKLSVGKVIKTLDVFDANEFRSFVNNNEFANIENPQTNVKKADFLGSNLGVNTNWQDEIFQDAFGTITDFSVSKGFKSTTLRASFNRSDQQGILLTDKFERNALNFNITQDLFDNNLKLTLTSKLSQTENRFADAGAIGNAIRFDPTQPITNSDGSFFEYPLTQSLSPLNPVAQLRQKDNRGGNKRIITNFNAVYDIPYVQGLGVNLNLGIDYAENDGREIQNPFTGLRRGVGDDQSSTFRKDFSGLNRNQLLETTITYKKDIESLNTKIDAVAGYSYQEFFRKNDETQVTDLLNPDLEDPPVLIIPNVERNLLLAYFGRVNFEIADKYLISGSLRRDGSSRFSEENQFGIFPGVSLGWKLHNEKFLENVNFLNQLKLRAGWGITGQQQIEQTFAFLPTFQPSSENARVQFGDQFVTTLRPGPINPDLKWEQTANYNLGIDYSMFDGRLSGSLDFYEKQTKDLLFNIPFASGSITTDEFIANIGETTARGVEFAVNGDIFRRKDFNWNLAYNITYNEVTLDKLTAGSGGRQLITDISGGGGNQIQILKPGFDPSSFSVYRQIYDANGTPIEGAFVDVNGDNSITQGIDEDRLPYKKGNPDVFMGLTSTMNYKNADFSFTFRGNFGGHNYNNILSETGNETSAVRTPGDFLINLPSDFNNTRFVNQQLLSDYYLQSSDFVRLDNVSLGYTFGLEKVDLRISATATNLFVITDYEGLDPEVRSGDALGVDRNAYPRPRTYVFGVNVKF